MDCHRDGREWALLEMGDEEYNRDYWMFAAAAPFNWVVVLDKKLRRGAKEKNDLWEGGTIAPASTAAGADGWEDFFFCKVLPAGGCKEICADCTGECQSGLYLVIHKALMIKPIKKSVSTGKQQNRLIHKRIVGLIFSIICTFFEQQTIRNHPGEMTVCDEFVGSFLNCSDIGGRWMLAILPGYVSGQMEHRR
ncbi:hypothetical protein CDAR_10051 [Caerostris darwini]|uniref:Uncharacterized protein n=1 Tax=Caerostris darwini TaxID=1538125 RepID=A0AAV4UBC4_9ARAC|nr:hypothetical protein CDAR_10051 [Caerostris darwini]